VTAWSSVQDTRKSRTAQRTRRKLLTFRAVEAPLAQPTSLGELARLFLQLGITGFGGPAAHIAMLRDEVVVRRAWLSEREFLDLLGATNLIPGPNSTEMALHVGWRRRRTAGLVVAGLAFIVPAVLITSVIAWSYVKYGSLPPVQWISWGIKPVIVAIVFDALVKLVPSAAKSWTLRAVGLSAIVAFVLGANELVVIFGAGAIVCASNLSTKRALPVFLPFAAWSLGASTLSLSSIFWIFLKIGSVLFGSGYVLIAFLRTDFVERLGVLTEAQLLDAVAVGQVTPGPVFSTATFIGYLLASWSGALVATIGIFLPAFVFVALSAPFIPRLRASKFAAALLDGVTIASLALMACVTFEIGRGALVDIPTIAVAIAAFWLLRRRINATWLIAGGGLVGLVKFWTA